MTTIQNAIHINFVFYQNKNIDVARRKIQYVNDLKCDIDEYERRILIDIRCFCYIVNKNKIVKFFLNCVFRNTLRFNHISINIELVSFVNRVHATLIWNKKNRLSMLTNHIFLVRRQINERKNLILNSKSVR